MEINIISKNLENETIRLNISNEEADFGNIRLKQFDSEGKLITGFDIPVKSLKNFIKEISESDK